MSPAARYRTVVLAVARRTLHNYFSNPALWLPSLIFPLVFFAGFAGGLSNIANVPGFDFPSGYTAFQFVFVMLQASAFGGVFTGFSIASDFENGFARRLLMAVPNRTAILLGYALVALTRTLLTVTIVFSVALISGMQVDGGGADLAGLLGLAVVIGLAAALFASGIALRLRTIQAGPLMQMPVFVVLFLAPVYVPLNLLSGWIHAVAAVNPMTALLQAGRALISGSPEGIALGFVVGAGLVAVFGVFALRGLRKAEAAG